MKNFILIATFSLFQFTALAEDCDPGKYFDNSLNRCVLSTKTVENKTEAMNCQGLSGEAAQSCFKSIVDGEVSELEASGKVESAKNPKGSMIIPAIVTLGSAYYLFMGSDDLKSCGSISVMLMLGGGVTTLLGEFLAKRKYKSKLKKMEKNYTERTADSNSAKDSDDLETINSNQTTAFDYQIEQERARESAHKTRKTVYTLATGLYAGATAAAIYEMVTGGFTASACKTKKSGAAPSNPSPVPATIPPPTPSSVPAPPSTTPPVRGPVSLFETESLNDQTIDLSIANLSNPETFSEYSYLEKVSSVEFREIIIRKLASIIIPTAHAQEAEVVASESATASEAAGKVKGLENIAGSPVFRAALSGILAIYSKKIASKASKLAKEAAARAEEIEKLRDNFLANGGAGFANCTESDRAKPSMPTCYCYQADGTRNPSKSNSPTCLAIYGRSGGVVSGSSNYDINGTGMPLSATGCLSSTGTVDESCNCKKTNSCSTINGSLNLGSLGNIDGLSRTVSDAANFSSGNISAGSLDSGSLERAVANISTQVEKMKDNPKAAEISKKIDDLGFKIEKSFGNSIRNAAGRGAISPALASFSGGGLGSGDDNSPATSVAALSPSTTTSNSPARVNLSSGGKTGVSIDDFDFNSKSTGGVRVQDENAQIMDREFKVDDISNNSSASIFSIISNRYQTTGLRTLFSEEEAANEN